MPEYIGFMLTELDFASLRLNHVLLLTPAVADALEIGTKLIKIQRQTEVACGHRRHHGTSQGLLMHESRSNLIGLFRNVFGTAVKCQACAVCSC